MSREAIVLAGGFGTRLKSVVHDRPKPLALIGGRSFLSWLVLCLSRNGFTHIVLSTGYMAELIEQEFAPLTSPALEFSFCREFSPLGTGGAIRQALTMCREREVFVFNGDTFFDIDMDALERHHRNFKADLTLCLKPLAGNERYGEVELEQGWVKSFQEKPALARASLINGGVYLIKRDLFADFRELPASFSLEKDFLQAKADQLQIAGLVQEGYFIDIGIPEDYLRAQQELPRLLNSPHSTNAANDKAP